MTILSDIIPWTHVIKGHELQARASVGGLVETTKIVPQIRGEANATMSTYYPLWEVAEGVGVV